ncbi:hypothetical protein DCC85_00370 [Paenibacillus sp. CAA11]|uniref:hypothetical protein n=1 Tax=Paenibacillus sp. CAA11 TaxID=1532905 RepID=UPI000D3B818E|nr:hypothetical protein [Paenibacillus sp. CAA11]AWB42846.1 hypothetical protein DCC85_00370 [Paenibacillus sp. CAA11]
MILTLIIACEVAFWVFVVSGLAVRYLFRKKQLGAVLLWCTPLIDLILIGATVTELHNGATASFFHGLAAVYVGVTLALGHSMINWADRQFAYRFAGGPKPSRGPRYGSAHAKKERQGWYRHLLAWMIGSAILGIMVLWIGDAKRTEQLSLMVVRWAMILGIDFLISFSYTLWPRSHKQTNRDSSLH